MVTRLSRIRTFSITLVGLFAFTQQASAELPELQPIQTLRARPMEVARFGNMQFGVDIAVSGDTALIGMPQTLESPGRVAVYQRNVDGRWRRTGTIRPATQDVIEFGGAIEFQGDIAAILASPNVFIFRRLGDAWIQTARFRPDDPTDVNFGRGRAFRYDDGFLTVGGTSVGIHIYELSPLGVVLSRTILTRPEPSEMPTSFGNSAALSGRLLVAGDTEADESRGAAYVYRRQQGNDWVLLQKLIAINGEPGDRLGPGLAVDGDDILVGAPGVDPEGQSVLVNGPPTADGHVASGAVIVFTRGNGVWSERERLRPTPDQIFDYAGFGIEIDRRGNRTVISAIEPPSELFAMGIAVIYQREGDTRTATALARFNDPFAMELGPQRQLLLGSPFEFREGLLSAIGFAEVFRLPD
jgi:hypothetical protein